MEKKAALLVAWFGPPTPAMPMTLRTLGSEDTMLVTRLMRSTMVGNEALCSARA